MHTILLAHPDEALRSFVLRGLSKGQFQAMAAAGSSETLARICQSAPNLVIMAEELPPVDGDDLVIQIRKMSDVPIIVLGNNGECGGARMLEMGGDSYLSKPLSINELITKVNSLIRRLEQSHRESFMKSSVTLTEHRSQKQRGDSEGKFDDRRQPSQEERQELKVQIFGSVAHSNLNLSPTESRLLSCLKFNEGKVVPHPLIITEVWGDKPVSPDLLKVYIRRLRQKLGDDLTSPVYILNERGIGYRWGNRMQGS